MEAPQFPLFRRGENRGAGRARRKARRERGIPLKSACITATFALVFVLPAAVPADEFELLSVTCISEEGGRVDWDKSGSDRIAFDKKNSDGYYDLYLINPDGTGLTGLTQGHAGIRQRNNGNPTWHPSGKYIVFQSEHSDHVYARHKEMSDPGIGCFSDLWATTPEGDKFWQLTFHTYATRPNDHRKIQGVLNPHFSPDGSKLFWTERFDEGGKWGKWRIWMADFVVDGTKGPLLQNARVVFSPSATMGDYVTCTDILADARTLLLAGNLEGQDEFDMDLHRFDVVEEALTDLTNNPKEWTEGSAFTPDGTKIIYMSNYGDPVDPTNPHWDWQKIKREYWVMNLDGSGKEQVTHFNTPGYPEYAMYGGKDVIVNDCSWSPDGTRLASTIGVDIGTGAKASYTLKVAVLTFSRTPKTAVER